MRGFDETRVTATRTGSGASGYGTSLNRPSWVCAQIEERPGLRLVGYREDGLGPPGRRERAQETRSERRPLAGGGRLRARAGGVRPGARGGVLLRDLGLPVVERWPHRDAIWVLAGMTRIGLWRPQVGLEGSRGGEHVHFAMQIDPSADSRQRVESLRVPRPRGPGARVRAARRRCGQQPLGLRPRSRRPPGRVLDRRHGGLRRPAGLIRRPAPVLSRRAAPCPPTGARTRAGRRATAAWPRPAAVR